MNAEKRKKSIDAANKKLRGKAYERASLIFDEGTFVETNRYVKARSSDEYDGVVTGYGSVDGRLVFAFIQDASRQNGAFGENAGGKISSLVSLAKKNGAALCAVFDSNGARVNEGSSVLDGYAEVMGAVAGVKGKIPVVSLILGNTSGCASTICALSDFSVMVKGATLSASPASLLESVSGNADIADAQYCAKKAMVSNIAENENEGVAVLRELLSYLPSNSSDANIYVANEDDINRETSSVEKILENVDHDVHELIAEICDGGRYFEVYPQTAETMVCAFANVGGINCGIVANDPSHTSGKLGQGGLLKASRFIEFCDKFGISILTLCSSEGFNEKCEAGGGRVVCNSARLALAYASASVPKITVYTGCAYGAAFAIMGSKALGADISYALPCAKISAMRPESAVAFLQKQRLHDGEDLEKLVDEWETVEASPEKACANACVDDVIEYAELRKRIISALDMLSMKRHFEKL